MIVGYVWYSPKLFGDKWAKFVGLSEAKMKKGASKTKVIAMVFSGFALIVLNI